MGAAKTARTIWEMDFKDNTTASLKRIEGGIKHLEQSTARAGGNLSKNFGQMGKGAGQLAAGLGRVGIIAAGALVTGLGASVKVAGDFEAQLNTINTVVKATGDAFTGDLGKIGNQIRTLARQTGTSTDDLTTAYYDLVSAGISAADAQNVLTQANTLAIGGLATTAQTVDLLTTAINAYGGDASKAKEYTDQLAQAINAGKVTADQIASSFSIAAPLAAQLGIGVDQIAATYANMTAKGIDAEASMTDMNSAMVALQRQTPALQKVLKSLGITDVEAELRNKGLAGTWDEIASAGRRPASRSSSSPGASRASSTS